MHNVCIIKSTLDLSDRRSIIDGLLHDRRDKCVSEDVRKMSSIQRTVKQFDKEWCQQISLGLLVNISYCEFNLFRLSFFVPSVVKYSEGQKLIKDQNFIV